MIGLYDYVKSNLTSEENAEEFAQWAFGNDFNQIFGIEKFANQWNEKHRDKFEIKYTSLISKDVPKLINIWRKSKKNE